MAFTELYGYKSRFKLSIFAFALLIAVGSLYYTNRLVKNLREREQEMIELYAKGLEALISGSDKEKSSAFLYSEIVESNTSIPVVLADEQGRPISSKNIDIPRKASDKEIMNLLSRKIEKMRKEHTPLTYEYAPGKKNYVYYESSFLLKQIRYFPYIQLAVISMFGFIAYRAFSASRKAEQNRVWIGLAKETAHQLGTPLSSLIAWLEIFKSDARFSHARSLPEIEEDIKKLKTITERFSNIGSVPALKGDNVLKVIEDAVQYLKKRISSQIVIFIENNVSGTPFAYINRALFEWVIENIIKNAVDATEGKGIIRVTLSEKDRNLILDIADNGKGMTRSQIAGAFRPGFTTKKRGWGLGLTLSKRIIEEYHRGKIFIKNSEIGKGTIFRIILKRL